MPLINASSNILAPKECSINKKTGLFEMNIDGQIQTPILMKAKNIMFGGYVGGYGSNPAPIKKTAININGKVEDFKQGKTGNCWALSGTMATSLTDFGSEAIKNSISKNKDGKVTVVLKGTDEKFTFTPKEILKQRRRLATGDDDVTVLSMAMEKHRVKAYLCKPSFLSRPNINASQFSLIPKEEAGAGNLNFAEPLTGGRASEAIFLLTGKRASRMMTIDENSKNKRTNLIKHNYNEDILKKIDYKLTQFAINPRRYAVTLSLNKKDEKRGMVPHHSYCLNAVQVDSVGIINPWNTKKKLMLGRKEFLNSVRQIEFCDTAPNF